MFQRRFKPAKCKKALQLVLMRIKFSNQNREAKLKQLKMEVSALLHNLQHQIAIIRVEELVLEQKRMVAYDLIGIYCELIASRMPLIDSYKNCPIDLKEAISSVIYASLFCSDIPELMDVRMHFTLKYGEKFVSDACQLRPDCGVNLLLVEKLSLKAPDGPTKIKIVEAIAEEHNIKWEPSDIVQSTFEKAAYVEPSEDGLANSCATSQLEPMHDASTHSYEHNASCTARKASGSHSTTSGMPNVEIRPSGDAMQEMNFGDSCSENQGAFPVQEKYSSEVSRGNINEGLRAHNKSSDFDSYALLADSPDTASIHEPHIQNDKSEARKKARSLASIRYFDSDDSDSEDELHKRNPASVARPIRRISYRT